MHGTSDQLLTKARRPKGCAHTALYSKVSASSVAHKSIFRATPAFLNRILRRALLYGGESDMHIDLKITNFANLKVRSCRTELAEFGHFFQKFDIFDIFSYKLHRNFRFALRKNL